MANYDWAGISPESKTRGQIIETSTVAMQFQFNEACSAEYLLGIAKYLEFDPR